VAGRRNLTIPAFVLLVLFWGSAFGAVKVGLAYSPPLLFAGARAALGGLAVGIVALFAGGPPRLRRDWGVFAVLALLNVVLFIGLQTFAILSLASGTAAVLIYLQPILVGLFAWLLLGEPLGPAKILGLLLGFSGIVAVSAGELSRDVSVAGVVLATVSALAWALGTVYFKRVEDRVSTLWAIALPFFAGGIVLGALGLATESPSDIRFDAPFVASLLYTALIGTGLAWGLWLGLVRAGEASRVAAYIFVVPLVSVALGVIFLDEHLSLSLAVGAVLVVLGIYLVNRAPRKGKTEERDTPRKETEGNGTRSGERTSREES
jgi:drug/metabolite transporter (DMT)-like permease